MPALALARRDSNRRRGAIAFAALAEVVLLVCAAVDPPSGPWSVALGIASLALTVAVLVLSGSRLDEDDARG